MKTKFIRLLLSGGLLAGLLGLATVARAQQLDFGDAPAPYPTLLNQNGARHAISNLRLGNLIDSEQDGQPNATATGDDINPPGAGDDEDGVTFLTALVPGQLASVRVNVNGRCRVDAWIDFNRNGSWADQGEQICVSVLVDAGDTTIEFPVPTSAQLGETFARFRVSLQGGLSFVGLAPDGEVEDYQVTIGQPQQPMDFGDAPDGPYPTLLRNNGARHVILQGFHLGQRVDAEPDGQPNANATGDDIGGGPDEDGVFFITPLAPGQSAAVIVVASQTGFLNAWIDFNRNGSWADSGDQIFTAVGLVPGTNTLVFAVPAGAESGATFARFRYSRQSVLSFDGPAEDGEVEDYQVGITRDRDRCDLGCRGRDFWLTFPGNYAPDPNNPARLSLCITGPGGTVGVVSIPGLGFSTNFAIPAAMAAIVHLPTAADLGDANDVITEKGIHVTASADVGVFGFNHARHTTDSYLGLPTVVLGTEYIVLGFGNTHSNVPPLNGTQFALVATETNTTVMITPSVTTGIRPAGVPYQLLMQPGETYQLRNTNDTPADLTGTIVQSDKPIAVFGSQQCANIPSSNVWFCDYIVEQLLPVNTWGTEFYTAPLATRALGDTFRALAAQDATTVSLNGVPVGVVNRGEFRQFQLISGARISADKPILVAQYANSSDYDGRTNADPFMSIVQATRHYVSGYIVCAPTNDFPTNYIAIIAPTSSLASVSVNGLAVPVASFTTISGSTYAYARILVGPGRHTVAAGVPIGVSIYGWAEYDSYGNPGCYFFGDVQPPRVTCNVSNITVNVDGGPNAPCGAIIPDLTREVVVEDNCSQQTAPPTQSPPAGTVVGPGVHPITISARDLAGNVGTCVVTFTVVDIGPVTLECPPPITVNCTSPEGAIVTYQVTARTPCNSPVTLTYSHPPGTLFPPGKTLVTVEAVSAAGQKASCEFEVTVLCGGTVTITPSPTGGGLTINWTGSTGTLESAPTPTGPWRDVISGVNSYTAPITSSNEFFRVRF